MPRPSPTTLPLPPVPSRTYTVTEVAQLLQVCDKTIRNHITAGRLRATRVGRCIRVTEGALQTYLAG